MGTRCPFYKYLLYNALSLSEPFLGRPSTTDVPVISTPIPCIMHLPYENPFLIDNHR